MNRFLISFLSSNLLSRSDFNFEFVEIFVIDEPGSWLLFYIKKTRSIGDTESRQWPASGSPQLPASESWGVATGCAATPCAAPSFAAPICTVNVLLSQSELWNCSSLGTARILYISQLGYEYSTSHLIYGYYWNCRHTRWKAGKSQLTRGFYVLYSTLFHLPPLRFHCVRGCCDWTQDCCDLGIHN
jgi:hypothetical protein